MTDPGDNAMSYAVGIGLAIGAGVGSALGTVFGTITGDMGVSIALGVPMGSSIGLVFGIIYATIKQHAAGVCQSCGYSTKGLKGKVCPECGGSVEKEGTEARRHEGTKGDPE